jgi:aryl-alcohol dehydrogenase-like predicted oxidoreductase
MGLIAYSPLAGGLLASALEKVTEGRRSSEYMQGEIDSNRERLGRWEHLCKELGERPSDVALAWLLHQPAVTAPIIGPRTEAQVMSSFRALEVRLPEDVLTELDEIFPGPGGPAPEAYAW